MNIVIRLYNKVKNEIIYRKNKFNIARSIYSATSDDCIIAYWSNTDQTKSNWGDAINPYLLEKLSGKKVIHINSIYNIRNKPVYCAVGSILHHKYLKYSSKIIIWGAGFISNDNIIQASNIEIYAVRGPLTRKKLIQLGYKCPEVYGDPALLFSLIYPKKREIKYTLGIIPHYVDYNDENVKKYDKEDDVIVIDVKMGIKEFVDKVLSCKYIASSSLHGIIIADSYNIPSIWIKLSNKIVGNDFKFYDYFISVGRKKESPLIINDEIQKKEIISRVNKSNISKIQEKLLDSCPFINDREKYRQL